MELFAKGKRGVIYRDGNICIKEKNPRSAVDTLANEAKFFSMLNTHGIGPKFLKYEKGKLYMDFVEGEHIGKFLENEPDLRKIVSVIRQVLEQCRKMDLLGVNKSELTNPYKDILVTPDNRAVMIDFERCRESSKPQNVTQFLQYIARNKEILGKKGILIDKEELIKLGKEYKEKNDKKFFDKIMNSV